MDAENFTLACQRCVHVDDSFDMQPQQTAPRAPATELSNKPVFAVLQAVSRVGLRIAIASGREPRSAVSSTVLRKECRPVAQTWRRQNLRGGSSDTFFERAPYKPFTHERMRIS